MAKQLSMFNYTDEQSNNTPKIREFFHINEGEQVDILQTIETHGFEKTRKKIDDIKNNPDRQREYEDITSAFDYVAVRRIDLLKDFFEACENKVWDYRAEHGIYRQAESGRARNKYDPNEFNKVIHSIVKENSTDKHYIYLIQAIKTYVHITNDEIINKLICAQKAYRRTKKKEISLRSGFEQIFSMNTYCNDPQKTTQADIYTILQQNNQSASITTIKGKRRLCMIYKGRKYQPIEVHDANIQPYEKDNNYIQIDIRQPKFTFCVICNQKTVSIILTNTAEEQEVYENLTPTHINKLIVYGRIDFIKKYANHKKTPHKEEHIRTQSKR